MDSANGRRGIKIPVGQGDKCVCGRVRSGGESLIRGAREEERGRNDERKSKKCCTMVFYACTYSLAGSLRLGL
jgi:hypothetical protein